MGKISCEDGVSANDGVDEERRREVGIN